MVIVTRMAVLSALLLTACSPAAQTCTAADATSGVWVIPEAPDSIEEFCVQDTCARGTKGSPFVELADSAMTVNYRITITDDNVVEGRVETRRYQINGPNCGPVTYNAILNLTADGEVTVSYLERPDR